jgi:hypothetical protein
VLIRSLPPESATKTAIRNNMNPLHTASAAKSSDAAQAPWSHTEMLLALLVDNIRWLIFVTLRVNGNKKAKAPEPLARPGVAPKGSRKPLPRTDADFEEVFRRINGGRLSGRWHHTPPGKANGHPAP